MHVKRCLHGFFAVIASVCLVGTAWGADTYAVDPSHSLVGFTVRHFVINKVRGKFNHFVGNIVYDENDLTKSSLQGTIQTASIDTDHEKRDAHLRSPDFFDTEKFPEITFQSKRVEKQGDMYALIGDLSMRGVTKEVSVPFMITGKIVDPQGKSRIGFEATLRLNRQDFGISWSKKMDNGGLVVSDTVEIELIGEAIKS